MLGNLLTEEQRIEEAVPLLEAAFALPEHSPTVRIDLGRAHLALGQPEKAVGHLSASLATDSDGSVHYQLAQAYQRLGMREQAREALAKYRELDTQNRRLTEASAQLEVSPPE